MTYEQQKQEIQTIKERNVSIKLSDADCERLSDLCGRGGLTIGELLASFIGDLVGGTYTNGSDERDLADAWFERCGYDYCTDSLLSHLINWGYDPQDYIDNLENIKEAKEDKKAYLEIPELYDQEEMSWIDDDIETWEEELKEMTNEWKSENPDMEKEVSRIREWLEERENLINNVDNIEPIIKL